MSICWKFFRSLFQMLFGKSVMFILVGFGFVVAIPGISNMGKEGQLQRNENRVDTHVEYQAVTLQIKFQYCSICGFHKIFQEFGNLINERYPQVNVVGETFLPQQYRRMTGKILSAVKMLLIACFISNINLVQYIRLGNLPWWLWTFENKLFSCLATFVIFEAMERYILTTGAFEIFLNDVNLWSTLKMGRVPHPEELFTLIDIYISTGMSARSE